jgi:DNA repair protein RadC
MKSNEQAIQLNVDEVKLQYKTKTKASERIKIKNSQEAYDVLIQHWDNDVIQLQEEFKILLLNRSHSILGIATISVGGLTGTVIDVRKILQIALKANSSSIILSHNHPSGNTNPSDADRSVTRKIKEAAAIMDINVLDHVIVCPEGAFFSFADEGLM